MDQQPILACPPVEVKDQVAVGIARMRLTPGMEKTVCERCTIACWIGPNQRERKKQGDCWVLCFRCAVIVTRCQSKVVSLGGLSNQYDIFR